MIHGLDNVTASDPRRYLEPQTPTGNPTQLGVEAFDEAPCDLQSAPQRELSRGTAPARTRFETNVGALGATFSAITRTVRIHLFILEASVIPQGLNVQLALNVLDLPVAVTVSAIVREIEDNGAGPAGESRQAHTI
ncbi:hypothetical protein EIP91_009863 [Steccherinum ochraceum]|uniref:Uncharacterized protein n=1 Tax=Steccherinum ochraceum TaxID=92696 RepID=A0A4R0R154_9APHY|nr:hypothetical protein EIP91_009863 [Steccherinum ochraceum]